MQLPEELRAQALIELQNAERLGGPTSAMNRLSRFYLIVFFILVRPVMKEEEEAWGLKTSHTVSKMLRSPSPPVGSIVTQSAGEFQGRLSGLKDELTSSLRETTSPPPRRRLSEDTTPHAPDSHEVILPLGPDPLETPPVLHQVPCGLSPFVEQAASDPVDTNHDNGDDGPTLGHVTSQLDQTLARVDELEAQLKQAKEAARHHEEPGPGLKLEVSAA